MKETSTLELRHQEEENKQYLSQIKTLQDKNASMARTILENEQNIQNFKVTNMHLLDATKGITNIANIPE